MIEIPGTSVWIGSGEIRLKRRSLRLSAISGVRYGAVQHTTKIQGVIPIQV